MSDKPNAIWQLFFNSHVKMVSVFVTKVFHIGNITLSRLSELFRYKASLKILMDEDSQCVNSKRHSLIRDTIPHGMFIETF